MVETPPDWIETLTRFGAALGMNPVKLRWKLMAWRESWQGARGRARATAQHVTYQHRVCPTCGNIDDRSNRACSRCGTAFLPRWLEVLSRFGIVAPSFLSISSLLTAGILAGYVRTVLAPGGNAFSLSGDLLIRYGGTFPPAVRAGEWWRLGCYIFLHAGLVHLAFNLIALQQIGPQIEQVFGRGKMLFVFMATGIAAGLASTWFRPYGVGIGASGSLMGLIGFAAGWGQRDGTPTGRNVRDFMVKWAVYVMIFGFLVGADNTAHAAGFLSGGVIGLFSRPVWQGGSRGADGVLGLVGAALAAGSLYFILFPPGLG